MTINWHFDNTYSKLPNNFDSAMDRVLNTVIVDDDPVSLKVLETLINQVDFLNLVGSYSDAISARSNIQDIEPDLLILDIEMPEMTGLELIGSLEKKPQVILVSGKKEYALEAYDYDVTDYLTKPLTFPRFLTAAERARERSTLVRPTSTANDEVYIKVDSLLVKFKLSDFFYFEGFCIFHKYLTASHF